MHAVLQEARPEKMSPATLEALKSGDGFGWLIEGYIYIRPPLSAKRLMKLVDAKWNLSTYSEKTMGAQKQGSKSLFAQGGHGNWFQEPTLMEKKRFKFTTSWNLFKELFNFFFLRACDASEIRGLILTLHSATEM